METFILISFLAFSAWWMLTALKGEKKRNAVIIAREKKQMDMYQRIIEVLDNAPEVQ